MPRPTLTRPELTEASLVDSLTAGVVSRPAHGHAGSAGVGTGGPAAGDASAGRRAHGLSCGRERTDQWGNAWLLFPGSGLMGELEEGVSGGEFYSLRSLSGAICLSHTD